MSSSSVPSSNSPIASATGVPVEPVRIDTDCFSCKIIGSAGSFAVGSYLLYTAKVGQFRGGKGYKLFLRAFGFGCLYVSAARMLYLPPFSHVQKKL